MTAATEEETPAETSIGGSLAAQKEKLTVLYYGKEGSAKSTNAAKLSELGRILVIDSEGGLKPTALRAQGVKVENIQVWPPDGNIDRITFETIEKEVFVPMKIELENDPASWVGVVIDSFSELYVRLTGKAADASRAKDRANGKQRGDFQTNLEDYGVSTSMMRQILRRFRDLDVHLVLTALERRDQDDDGFVQYGPAVGPATANDTMGLVDVVCWTQAEELGPRALPFMTGTLRPKDRHRAKDRFGILPPRMIDPSADRLVAYLDGSMTKKNDPRHAAGAAAMKDA